MPAARTRTSVGYARRLITRYRVLQPAVDVVDIARRLNIEVKFEEFPAGISGALYRGPERTIIAANQEHHEHRQRFTIAHELGHFFLHPDCPAYYDRENQVEMHFRAKIAGTVWDPRETEANRFAAELLMPRRLLVEAIRKAQDFNAASLAEVFNVSGQAMAFRLAELRFA